MSRHICIYVDLVGECTTPASVDVIRGGVPERLCPAHAVTRLCELYPESARAAVAVVSSFGGAR
ncbi:hypothetical protein ACWEQ4_01515 [Rhodococcus sp. NPDC003994]